MCSKCGTRGYGERVGINKQRREKVTPLCETVDMNCYSHNGSRVGGGGGLGLALTLWWQTLHSCHGGKDEEAGGWEDGGGGGTVVTG